MPDMMRVEIRGNVLENSVHTSFLSQVYTWAVYLTITHHVCLASCFVSSRMVGRNLKSNSGGHQGKTGDFQARHSSIEIRNVER